MAANRIGEASSVARDYSSAAIVAYSLLKEAKSVDKEEPRASDAGLAGVGSLADHHAMDKQQPGEGWAFLETYADRLFFATDMVNTEMVFPLGEWLDRQVADVRLSRTAYESVCRENARRVFGL